MSDSQQTPAAASPDSGAQRLQAEIAALRDSGRPEAHRMRELERRLMAQQASLATLGSQNDRLTRTLKDARAQIVNLRAEVDRLGAPPNGYGVVLSEVQDGSVDILTAGRKMRVAVAPSLAASEVTAGREVMLNEALNVVAVKGFEKVGEVVLVKEVLDDDRLLVVAHADEERVCRRAASLIGQLVRVGDALTVDPRSGFVFERVPKAEVQDLVLEEVPDIAYEDIGGLAGQIEAIRDAVELPYLHPELYKEHHLKAPKGVLLYGPPGCGKTLIAKAVAASLARKVAERTGRPVEKSYFLNIKGPELLNKYVP